MSARKTCAGTVTNDKYGKLGQPCQRWAVKGSDFCVVHGGKPDFGDPATLANRCTANNRFGERCRNAAIVGGTVCRSHGGALPNVQRKARERFNDLIDPMINIAHKMAVRAEAGQMSDSDTLAFMKFVADRTGFVPGREVALEVEVKPWERALQTIVREIPAVEAQPVLDAEVIEDEPEPDLEEHPRDYLPQIVPSGSSLDRASIRRPSAEPPSHLR